MREGGEGWKLRCVDVIETERFTYNKIQMTTYHFAALVLTQLCG